MTAATARERYDELAAMIEALPDPGDAPTENERRALKERLFRLGKYKAGAWTCHTRRLSLDPKIEELQAMREALHAAIDELEAERAAADEDEAARIDELLRWARSGPSEREFDLARAMGHNPRAPLALVERMPGEFTTVEVEPLDEVEYELAELEAQREAVLRKFPEVPTTETEAVPA